LIWAQVAGNQFTRYCPNDLLPESLVKAAGSAVHVEFHNITDILYSALDYNSHGVPLSQVVRCERFCGLPSLRVLMMLCDDKKYAAPPPSRVLFAPITLATEVLRIPTLRKKLIQFYRNVSTACLSERSIFYVPYQQVCVWPLSQFWFSH
jgi:hypothetical protein